MYHIEDITQVKRCSGTYIRAINDSVNVLNGKWKLPIIGVLLFGKKRFKELEREIPKITARMLSKELRDLEANAIVIRTVHNTIPVTVEYELSPSGQTFAKVLDAMVAWGLEHRQNVLHIDKPVSEETADIA